MSVSTNRCPTASSYTIRNLHHIRLAKIEYQISQQTRASAGDLNHILAMTIRQLIAAFHDDDFHSWPTKLCNLKLYELGPHRIIKGQCQHIFFNFWGAIGLTICDWGTLVLYRLVRYMWFKWLHSVNGLILWVLIPGFHGSLRHKPSWHLHFKKVGFFYPMTYVYMHRYWLI